MRRRPAGSSAGELYLLRRIEAAVSLQELRRHARQNLLEGLLKLSLVTCPVAMSPATTEGEKVRFQTLNRETGNRVVSRYIDAESGEPVGPDDQVKGYEAEAGRLALIEDEVARALGSRQAPPTRVDPVMSSTYLRR